MSRIALYYLGAFFQGLCLILLTALSFHLKAPAANALSDAQYGVVFLPMILVTILVTVYFQHFLRKWGRPALVVLGLGGNLLHLAFLMTTRFTYGNPDATLYLLWAGELALGIGFGFFMPLINILTAERCSGQRTSALAGLHACFGIGACASPLLVYGFYEKGFWQGAPMLTAAGFGLVAVLFLFLPAREAPAARVPAEGHENWRTLPRKAWLFILAILVYGIAESTVASWTPLYLTEEKGLSPAAASVALSLFWGWIMGGRLIAMALTLRIDGRIVYRILPWIMATGFLLILSVTHKAAILPAYMIAGLGCSCFLPLTISLSGNAWKNWHETLTALTIAGLMIGVGLGTTGTGFLREQGWMTLHHANRLALVCSVLLVFLTAFLAKRAPAA